MRKIYVFFLILILASGCQRKLNPSVMFKTTDNYPYNEQQTLTNIEYKIAPNDIIGLSVYTNDGFKLIDLTASAVSVTGGSENISTTAIRYTVDIEGYVKLPIIGRVKIKDVTIRDAEKLLETQYATYYNKPFVVLTVLNRRVLVFPGTGGLGKVVILENENTSLIEALALAGGITETGKAYKIKVIRGDTRNPQVTLVDLSTMDGMKRGNMLLQANDIIYIEPVPRTSQAVFTQILPIIGIITSFLLVYDIIVNRTNP
ncbi:MAG: polysaccharide biosynthesis/export family protein [Bacteroidia bacterium]